MSTHKYFDRICCIALAAVLVLTVLMMNAEALGIKSKARTIGYEERLFDNESVHTIDIVIDDWEGFLESCTNEEYEVCSVVIDGEAYKNVGIRAKGNTSLSTVASYDSDRYSFKIEFDHYDNTKSYHGLDKLSLNNIIQDNTYMKDYLVYTMMADFGAASPLCSYAYITVNGEDWGLYLAVEALEDSFLQRNYGSDYGELYKPDSMSFGGGRGNGMDFDFSDFMSEDTDADSAEGDASVPSFESFPELSGEMPEGFDISQLPDMGDMEIPGGLESFVNKGGMNFGGMGSDDVKLAYIDDDPDSYSNIFGNAKTDITEADQQRLIKSLRALSGGENIEDVVDIESVIRYFVVHNFVCNGDSYTGTMIHNYYLYEEDGVLAMLPWDYNLAFGGFESGDATSLVNTPINTPVSGGIGEDRPMVSWIFKNEEYNALYEKIFSDFITEYFESGYFSEMTDRVSEMIAPYVEKDPTKFCSYEEFEVGVETIKEFCLLRAESVRGQLEGSIGSTTEEQTDKSGFIDASHINISDMGSMGIGGGEMNGGFGFGGKGQRSEKNDEGEDEDPATGSSVITASANIGSMMPQMPEGMGTPPEGFEGQMPGNFGGQIPEGFEGQMPEGFEGFSSDTSDGGEADSPSDSEATSEGDKNLGGRPGGDMNFPGISGEKDFTANQGEMPGTAAEGNMSNITLLIVSVLVLAIGLVIAFLFKGRMQ